MPQLFSRTTLSLTIAAVVLALLAIPIRRMMHNVRDTSASAAANPREGRAATTSPRTAMPSS